MRDAGGPADITVRRIAFALVAAVACGWIFTTAVFLNFDAIRIRLVREATPTSGGVARVIIRDERAADLRPPFALIARIRNDIEEPQRFAIRINARSVCEADVPAATARRVDCAVREWDRPPGGELVIESFPSHPWTLEYLELATHHGRSTGWLHALVVPSGSSDFYTRPSRAWTAVVGMTLAALLLLRSPRIANRRLRLSHWIASGVAMVPFAAVLLAAAFSPYRVALSAGTFAAWLSIPLLPRLWSIVRFLWLALPIAVRTTIVALPVIAFGRPWKLVGSLAVAVAAVSVMNGARVVGAADEYGYLSQADLWLSGRLLTDQSFVRDLPWPAAQWWFSPLGYRPHPSNADAIVPAYSPGLPMMLALAKLIGGQEAAFFVVPLCGGLLVLATYGLGRRLVGSGIAPLVAAWLVATSPVVLGYSMSTMSDVPVAAAWTGAFYLLLGTSTASAAGAGLLSGFAVLIRPNLAPLVLVLGFLYVLRMRESGIRSLVHLAVFGAAAAPAAVIVAVVNNHLYGSPLTSGYGRLADLFDRGRMFPNLRNYLVWLVEAHTPAVLVGVAALAVPARRLWSDVRERFVFVVIWLFVVALWAIYCAWIVFDSWWFTRFLLSSFPFIMLGLGVCADALFRMRSSWIRVAVVGAVVALGIVNLQFAWTNTVFVIGHGMRRYAVAAALTRRVTEPNSVVFALNHSGSVRYYGGRMTINIGNVGEGVPLDDIVDWLQQRGVRTYATFEDWEIKEFSTRFAGAARLAALKRPPRATFTDPGQVMVFELSDPGTAAGEPVTASGLHTNWRAVSPAPPPTLVINRAP